jgi:hypothetical protein
MEIAPVRRVLEVGFEMRHEGGVVGDFAALDLGPGAVGGGGADGVVYVAYRDFVVLFLGVVGGWS